MKTKLAAILVLVLLAAMLTGCASRGTLRARDAQIASLTQELEEALNQCKVLEDEIKVSEDRIKSLEGELGDLSDELKIEIEQNDKFTMLRIPEKLLFNSSQINLSRGGSNMLSDIAGILGRYPEFDIRIEGHTDNRPIKPEFYNLFRSNWELSTARATEVLRFLINKKGISPDRLVAVGYGEYRPIASNDDIAGRSQNRRVEFFIAPSQQVRDLSE